MRRTILTAAAVVLTGASLAACTSPKAQPVAKPAPSPITFYPLREAQPQPVETRFPDCGDGDAPCVTYDDGDQGNGMYLVVGYNPYHAILMPTCDIEDYPTNMPCVLKHQDPQDRWITLRAPQ